MKRKTSVVWEGGFPDGNGTITRGTLGEDQHFVAPAGGEEGTNAESIAAALAVCFALDLTNQLGEAGFTPKRINATIAISLEKQSPGWTIISGQLDVLAQVPGARQGDFISAAVNAKNHCPILPLLKATIFMNARLIA